MLLASVIGAGFTLAICLMADRIGAFLGILDAPDSSRKLHDRTTPLVGGLAVVVPIVCAGPWLAGSAEVLQLFAVLAAVASGFLAIGFIDDRQHLPPLVRLLLSAAICYAVVETVPVFAVTLVKFSFLSQALYLGAWAAVFSILCLVGLKNAVNMADGKNGLVLGLCLIWTLLIAIYAPPYLTPLLTVMALTLVIVLPFNLAGRLFLGDSGCYALSIVIGLLAIHTYQANIYGLPADVVALWFLIPVVDCLRQTIGRLVAGRSPFRPDRNHLHHHLNTIMRWRWGLCVYLALVAGPALLAWISPGLTILWMAIALSCYSTILGLGIRQMRESRLTKLSST